jgi:hypothetical protein
MTARVIFSEELAELAELHVRSACARLAEALDALTAARAELVVGDERASA